MVICSGLYFTRALGGFREREMYFADLNKVFIGLSENFLSSIVCNWRFFNIKI